MENHEIDTVVRFYLIWVTRVITSGHDIYLLFNLTEQYRKLWFSDIDRRLGSLIDFYILWLSNLSPLSVLDVGYYNYPSCTLN